MSNRKIEKILTPKHFNWVGDAFYTTSFIGKDIPRTRMSPFFAVGYNADIHFSAREIPRGVGAHPHKGFETVTIAYKGKIEHKDSKGNHGVISEGDVQWMTAGSGILHQEYHEKEFSKTGGTFQMVQIWVNLPAKDKETSPKYQNLLFNQMTRVPVSDNGSYINVITGNYLGNKGKGSTFSPLDMYNAYLKKGTKADFTFSNIWNAAILVIEGSVTVNSDILLSKDSFAMFENNGGDTFNLESSSDDTIVLVMSGEPLNEPIAHYGPFVMNTQEQLAKAFEDFQNGKFGTL
ncbi:pirin family protein [Chryseobacterium sp. Tr-659]|uniref:pirin family protein n=1 Tax=Chryseobacterium sp. Tr-659 TaxID=2608340 RepID=UPI0014202FDC|nr:pirin family protein [Chryseobacterium sp. Tr-659]NIF06161.1 pirin family protein [Chryseobacterium sp. Tr-659]